MLVQYIVSQKNLGQKIWVQNFLALKQFGAKKCRSKQAGVELGLTPGWDS